LLVTRRKRLVFAVSGATVIVALAPVLLLDDPLIREVVIGPMVAVAVVVAAALSLRSE